MIRRTLTRNYTWLKYIPYWGKKAEKTTQWGQERTKHQIKKGGGADPDSFFDVYVRKFFLSEYGPLGVTLLSVLFLGVFSLPFLQKMWKKASGGEAQTIDTKFAQPALSLPWWQNKWRAGGSYGWKTGEFDGLWVNTTANYVPHFDYLKAVIGEDLIEKAKEVHEAATKEEAELAILIHEGKATADQPRKHKRLRALVPLCGDNPIAWQLVQLGFEVDAVDFCDTPMKLLSQTADKVLRLLPGSYGRLHLHYSDIFSSELWEHSLPKGGYDLIYDRRASSVLSPIQFDDFSFLMKTALKPSTGVLFVEGIYRTARSRDNNRFLGPPFHFVTEQVEKMYPPNEGFLVKCQEPKEVKRAELPPEARVTGLIPTYLKVRAFPCAVWQQLRNSDTPKHNQKDTIATPAAKNKGEEGEGEYQLYQQQTPEGPVVPVNRFPIVVSEEQDDDVSPSEKQQQQHFDSYRSPKGGSSDESAYGGSEDSTPSPY